MVDLGKLVPFLGELAQRERGKPKAGRRSAPVLPRPQPPKKAEDAYTAAIRKLLAQLPRIVREVVLPRVGELSSEPRGDGLRLDQDKGKLAKSIAAAARDALILHPSVVERVARAGVDDASEHSKRELGRQLQVVRVDPIGSEEGVEDKLREATKENVGLIKSIPAKFFDELEDELVTGVRVGRRAETISERLLERYGSDAFDGGAYAKALRRARFVARDQVGKLQGELTGIRQQNLGVTRYRWRTARDERVRGNPGGRYPDAKHSHHSREGQIFEWGKPPPDGPPGKAILCRCIAEPVFEDLLDGLSLAESAGPAIFTNDPAAFVNETLGLLAPRRRAPVAARKPPAPPPAPRRKAPPKPKALPPPKLVPPPPPPPPKPAGPPFEPEVFAGALDRTVRIRGGRFSAQGRPAKEAQAAIRQQLDRVVGKHNLKPLVLSQSQAFAASKSLGRGVGATFNALDGTIKAQPILVNGAARFARGDRDEIAQMGMQALLHETVHSTSPLGVKAYAGAGRWIEEVTTEVAARRIAADLGADRYADVAATKHGAYQTAVERVSGVISGTLGIDTKAAHALLEEASFAMRRDRPQQNIADPEDYVRYFASHVPVGDLPAPETAAKRQALAQALSDSLRTWDGRAKR